MMNPKWRLLSAALCVAGVAFIWSRVVLGEAPGHGGLSLMLFSIALNAVHAVGWRCQASWERLLFAPPLPWILWLLGLYLCW
ncbi:hypothetical protein [Gallaecimonas sp. GXIMD1310]|uniref:hypothetical protein n=1 Tax=Gallaecimonas sp. GXIMD1310 TaxID=3131926 RepID=UPI0032518E6C